MKSGRASCCCKAAQAFLISRKEYVYKEHFTQPDRLFCFTFFTFYFSSDFFSQPFWEEQDLAFRVSLENENFT